MYFPKHAIHLHDNWYASGLCGTSSGDMTVENLRVPEGHTLSMISGRPWCDGPLYRFPCLACWRSAAARWRSASGAARSRTFANSPAPRTPTLSRRTLAERGAGAIRCGTRRKHRLRQPGHGCSTRSAEAGTPPRGASRSRSNGVPRCGLPRRMRSMPRCAPSTPAIRSAAVPRSIAQAPCSDASARACHHPAHDGRSTHLRTDGPHPARLSVDASMV